MDTVVSLPFSTVLPPDWTDCHNHRHDVPAPRGTSSTRRRVRLYEAATLKPGTEAATPQPHRPVPSLLNRMLAAQGPDEHHGIVRSLCLSLGFEWMAYGQLTPGDEPGMPASICTTWSDAAWLMRYVDGGFFDVDPRLREALQSNLPCVWAIDDLPLRAPGGIASEHFARFTGALREAGMRSGIVFALPGNPAGQERCFISLVSRRGGCAWINDTVLGQAWTLALCVHEYQSQLAAPAQGADEPLAVVPLPFKLTPMQQSILRCLASGLGDKGIASYLGLTLHNVDYHMRQLRKRFGVRNRVQLMQSAQRSMLT